MKPEQNPLNPSPSEVIRILKTFFADQYFLPYQLAWITDPHPLKIMQKSRQVGITYADAFEAFPLPPGSLHLEVWSADFSLSG